MSKITIQRRGKPYEIDPQVIRWRKRMRRFRKYRRMIFDLVLEWHSGDVAQAEAFLRSPNASLGGAAPRQFLNPSQIRRLWKWISRGVKSS